MSDAAMSANGSATMRYVAPQRNLSHLRRPADGIKGTASMRAIRTPIENTGTNLALIYRIETNEAFGLQCLAFASEAGIRQARLNVNGEVIATSNRTWRGSRLAASLA